jgi:hypothetical protein
MRKLFLTNGGYTILDDNDFDYFSKWKWCIDSLGYVRRVIYLGGGRKHQKSKSFYLHREILKTPNGYETDHINRDKLDNRKSNLRITTRQQNGCNRILQSNNTSGYRGVTWNKDRQKWQAQIKAYQKHYYLGLFNDKFDAAKAYNKAAIKYFNRFAKLNYET